MDDLPHVAQRQSVIATCHKMKAMGLNQSNSGNVSCRVLGGFLVNASGVPFETLRPEQVVFIDEDERYYGDYLPSSDWHMHCDIYRHIPDAAAIVHAHPTYCTALSSQRRGIPAFHYMVAVAGGREIQCSDYRTLGSKELSDAVLSALGPRRSALLANHGMICYGPNLDKALWLANETECLARQYLCALSTGVAPQILSSEEMDVMLAKFKSYGKQPEEIGGLSEFERKHAIIAPPRMPDDESTITTPIPYLELRQKVIETCLKMGEMGINQGTSGNASCRVPGGFVVTASGVPYEKMRPEQVVFMNLDGAYSGDFMPSSEWRMHYDIYKRVPDAGAVVHAHPTYSTALACQRSQIPAFHYMVAAAGGKDIPCADYSTFGTEELSNGMLAALSGRRSTLLANHGMICYGEDLDQALCLANETESLAKQYVCALATGVALDILPDEEMEVMVAKLKTYGKQSVELAKLSDYERRHAVPAPRLAGPVDACCQVVPELTATQAAPKKRKLDGSDHLEATGRD